jgi:hypothetical protein
VRLKQKATIEPLIDAVMRIVADVGAREGYDLIVRGELVLYGRQTVDLTPAIVAEMDKRVDELRALVLAPAPKAAPAPAEEKKETAEPLPLIP